MLRTAAVAGIFFSVVALCQTPDRAAVEWVLRLGGNVTLEGRPQAVADLAELPSGEFSIEGIDLVGTLADPNDLEKLKDLSRLRDLFLPGPMWNPRSGSKLDANDAFASLSHLPRLEKLHFS